MTIKPIPIIKLNPGKEQSPLRFHPWVFSGAIKSKTGETSEGDVVEVQDSRGVFLGLGHYQEGTIAVRIFAFKKADIDERQELLQDICEVIWGPKVIQNP